MKKGVLGSSKQKEKYRKSNPTQDFRNYDSPAEAAANLDRLRETRPLKPPGRKR